MQRCSPDTAIIERGAVRFTIYVIRITERSPAAYEIQRCSPDTAIIERGAVRFTMYVIRITERSPAA
jgi:hypothetical protein